ncbi:hypothetical protein BC826DRAFT_1179048, partial [Russula brevipes]
MFLRLRSRRLSLLIATIRTTFTDLDLRTTRRIDCSSTAYRASTNVSTSAPTVDAPARKFEKAKRNIGRRNKGKIRKGPSGRLDIIIGPEESQRRYWERSVEAWKARFPSALSRPHLSPEKKQVRNWTRRTRAQPSGAQVHPDGHARAPSSVPLLRKNLLSVRPTTASAITVAALDRSLPAVLRVDVNTVPPDVLLIVDRNYHPRLVRPLLATMTIIVAPRHTATVVVAELRAEDVDILGERLMQFSQCSPYCWHSAVVVWHSVLTMSSHNHTREVVQTDGSSDSEGLAMEERLTHHQAVSDGPQ